MDHLSWIALSPLAFSLPSCVMDIDEEIKARIRAAKVWDKEAKFEDFQIKAAENGYVLTNLRTGRVQLIYDEFSELHDLEELYPDRPDGRGRLRFFGSRRHRVPSLR